MRTSMCAPARAASLYAYDNRFFDTADRTAAISAGHVVRLLAEQLPAALAVLLPRRTP